MKNNPAKKLTTEQLATLTARLVAAGIIPKLTQPSQMFHLALEYWRSCESYLTARRGIDTQIQAGRANQAMNEADATRDVPKPAKYPVAFQWILKNLFDGDRNNLRDYIKYCQSTKTWPAGDLESFIEPLIEGTDVEGYHYLTRRWYEWRQLRTGAVRRKGSSKRRAKKPSPRKAATKKGRAQN